MTGGAGAGGGTTSGANFSPTDSKSGMFVGGSISKLYKRKVKKEGAYIKHKTPSSAGKTHSLTYGTQDLKVFNKSQPDSAGSFYQKISKLF